MSEIAFGHYCISNTNTPGKLLEVSTSNHTSVTIGNPTTDWDPHQLWYIWGEGSYFHIRNGTGKYLAVSPPGAYSFVKGRDESQVWIVEVVHCDYNFYGRIYANGTGLCLEQLPVVNGTPRLQLVETSPDRNQVWKFWQMGT